MGEPAVPTPTDRARTRAYAKSVVEAVANDEDRPYPRFEDGDAMTDDTMVFDLSVEIMTLETELRVLRAVVQEACTIGLRFAAARLQARLQRLRDFGGKTPLPYIGQEISIPPEVP